MKASLICTVKNEEKSVKTLLDSLLSQSRLPDEIVIVDGGSTDHTIEILNSYVKDEVPIKLIVQPGVSIAQGRNIAIKNAEYDYIVSTDAGSRLEKDWFKNIVKPFEEDKTIQVVSGWYEPEPKTDFEALVVSLTCFKVEDIKPESFLPSSRSVAFKRICWKQVNGYPEWLTLTAEDTLFDIKLKEAGFKFYFAKDAVVYWRPRSTYTALLKQYYLYGRGNGEANLFTGAFVRVLFLKYVLGIFLFVMGFVNLFFWILLLLCVAVYVKKFLRQKNGVKGLVLHNLISMARVTGFLIGRIMRFKIKRAYPNVA